MKLRNLLGLLAVVAAVVGVLSMVAPVAATGSGPTIDIFATTPLAPNTIILGAGTATVTQRITTTATNAYNGYNASFVSSTAMLTANSITDLTTPGAWGGPTFCLSALHSNAGGALAPPLEANFITCSVVFGGSGGPTSTYIGGVANVVYTPVATGVTAVHMVEPPEATSTYSSYTINAFDGTIQTDTYTCTAPGSGGPTVPATSAANPLCPIIAPSPFNSVAIIIIAPPPTLTILKSATTPSVVAGQPYSFHIKVTNPAAPPTTSTATGVVVTDTLAAAYLGGPVTFAGPGAASCAFASPTVTCTVGTLQQGASFDVDVNGTTTSTSGNTSPSNCASVASTSPAFTPPAPSCTSVAIIPPGTLAISKSALTPSVVQGQPASFTITVTNPAPPPTTSTATGVVVTDTLAAAYLGGPVTFSGPGAASCAFVSPTVTCTVGSLAQGASFSVTVNVVTTTTSGNTSPLNCASVTTTNPAFTASAPSCTSVIIIIPPATNPISSGPIRLEADGQFCPNATLPCVTPFPGNTGGLPTGLTDWEWRGTTPLAFNATSGGAVPVALGDHSANSFVYTRNQEDPAGSGRLSIYLAYDFLGRTTALGLSECLTVQFDVAAGQFAGRMSVQICGNGSVLVSGFNNGVAFSNLPGSSFTPPIEGKAGFGKSPNPTGDSFFDVFLNTNHVIAELEIGLTRTLGGGLVPGGGGVYDPSPAWWSASIPSITPVVSASAGALVVSSGTTLSSNVVSVNTQSGANITLPAANPSNPFLPFFNPGAGQPCIQNHGVDTNGDGYSDADQATPAGAPTCTGAFPASGGLGQDPAMQCPGRPPGSPAAQIARADVNLDGAVNGLDLNQMAKVFLQSYVSASDYRAEIDFNGDKAINGLDLNVLAKWFTRPVPPC